MIVDNEQLHVGIISDNLAEPQVVDPQMLENRPGLGD
jgi:hypothetical protein